ncbi:hypothetical protein ACFPM0_31820 [Pseudonocardia sulfidoxydans]|uniref:hypothetical protein n=1 Tax=Pseudonocardia sulfidoxydans TaxID=54011 RepID=UPI00360C3D12
MSQVRTGSAPDTSAGTSTPLGTTATAAAPPRPPERHSRAIQLRDCAVRSETGAAHAPAARPLNPRERR